MTCLIISKCLSIGCETFMRTVLSKNTKKILKVYKTDEKLVFQILI